MILGFSVHLGRRSHDELMSHDESHTPSHLCHTPSHLWLLTHPPAGLCGRQQHLDVRVPRHRVQHALHIASSPQQCGHDVVKQRGDQPRPVLHLKKFIQGVERLVSVILQQPLPGLLRQKGRGGAR